MQDLYTREAGGMGSDSYNMIVIIQGNNRVMMVTVAVKVIILVTGCVTCDEACQRIYNEFLYNIII